MKKSGSIADSGGVRWQSELWGCFQSWLRRWEAHCIVFACQLHLLLIRFLCFAPIRYSLSNVGPCRKFPHFLVVFRLLVISLSNFFVSDVSTVLHCRALILLQLAIGASTAVNLKLLERKFMSNINARRRCGADVWCLECLPVAGAVMWYYTTLKLNSNARCCAWREM